MDISKLLDKAKECADMRKYDLAIQLYREALKLSPDSAAACRDLRALEVQLAKENPTTFLIKTKNAGLLAKGNRLMAAKKWYAAIETAEDVLVTEPGNISALMMLANAAREAGYTERAFTTLEYIRALNANNN